MGRLGGASRAGLGAGSRASTYRLADLHMPAGERRGAKGATGISTYYGAIRPVDVAMASDSRWGAKCARPRRTDANKKPRAADRPGVFYTIIGSNQYLAATGGPNQLKCQFRRAVTS